MSAFPDPHIWLAHRVAHEETDANGELYHAKYLHLFEKGSSEFMRAHSIGYAEMESRALFLPVREAAYRCHASARYDEPFWIRAGIGQWGRASCNTRSRDGSSGQGGRQGHVFVSPRIAQAN